jgi:hypothetical protein
MDAEQGLHTLQEVDLVNIIGVGQRFDKDDPSKQFFLPRDVFNVNTAGFRQKEISRYIAAPCYKAGFEIVMKGWEKEKQCLRFMCNTGRCYHSNQSKTTSLTTAARKKDANVSLTESETELLEAASPTRIQELTADFKKQYRPRGTKSERPKTSNETCKFSIPLYWKPTTGDQGVWYFVQNGAGCLEHEGHMQKTEEEAKILASHVSKEAIQLSQNIMNCNVDSGTAAAIVLGNYGERLTQSQILHLRRVGASMPQEVNHRVHMSAAERLIDYCEREPSLSYMMLTAEQTVADNYVTLPRPRVRLLATAVSGNRRTVREVPTGSLHRSTDADADTAESWAQQTMRSLSINVGGAVKVLVSIAWVSNEQIRFASCFPEAAGMDVQFGMNIEKRNTFIMTTKTSENEIQLIFQCFMPSSARWAFNWIATEAVPGLLGSPFCTRLRALLSDGEEKMYGPFVDQMTPTGLYPNCKHFRCMYHLVYRDDREPNIKARDSSGVASSYHHVLRQWVVSLSQTPETLAQFTIIQNKLICWLRSDPRTPHSPRRNDRLGANVCDEYVEFLTKVVLPQKRKFAFFERLTLRSFDMRTTSNTEAEGAALKKTPTATKPYHQIDKSAKAITDAQTRRCNKKNKDAAASMNSHTPGTDPVKAELEAELTDYAVRCIVSEYEAASDYWVLRMEDDDNTFFVTKKQYATYSSDYKDRNYHLYLIPQFACVRVVTIEEHKGEHLLRCDCGKRERWGLVCRHACAVMGRPPQPDDMSCRWTKDYLYCYRKEGYEEMTHLFDKDILNELPGVAIPYPFRPGYVGNTGGNRDIHLMIKQRKDDNNLQIRQGNFWSETSQSETQSSTTNEQSAVPNTSDYLGLTQSSRPSRYRAADDGSIVTGRGSTGSTAAVCLDGDDNTSLSSWETDKSDVDMQDDQSGSEDALDRGSGSANIDGPTDFGGGDELSVKMTNTCICMEMTIPLPSLRTVNRTRPQRPIGNSYQQCMHLFQQASNLGDSSTEMREIFASLMRNVVGGMQILGTKRGISGRLASRQDTERVVSEEQDQRMDTAGSRVARLESGLPIERQRVYKRKRRHGSPRKRSSKKRSY